MSTAQTRLITSTEHAAYLLSAGFLVRGTQPTTRGVIFLFDDDPHLETALLQFTNGEAKVEPRAFLRALSDLRDLARSQGVVR